MTSKRIARIAAASLIAMSMLPISAFAATIQTDYINVVSSVSFREDPSTSGDRIRYLKKDEELEVLSRYNSYWLQVKDSSGVSGYVSDSSKYVSIFTKTINIPDPKPIVSNPNAEVVATVSYRTGPNTSDSRIRYLRKGELITIVEQVNDYWFKALDENGTEGYVSTNAKYIDSSFRPSEEEAEEAIFRDEPNATVKRTVNFRVGPATDATRIRYLRSDEPLLILKKVNDNWYKAQDQNGVVGYVSTNTYYIETSYKEPKATSNQSVEAVIAAGMKYIGTPYEFGSSRYDLSTFDCSDFTRQAFWDALELRIPGDSRSQADYVKEIGKTTTNINELKRGDLMFFMSYKGYRASDYEGINKAAQRITHVGIYLGDGKVLHTYSKDSGGVRIDEISGRHWEQRFIFGGSAL
jgi:peptidoglycan DL-endopeptidase CwlO